MLNKVFLIGNLTRDAETVGGAGSAVTRMRVATHVNWRDAGGEWQRKSEFHALVAFGDLADRCALSCVKGRKVFVEGRLRTQDYLGADGLRRWSTEIVADRVTLLDRLHDDSAEADPQEETEKPQGVPDLAVSGGVRASRTERRTARGRSTPGCDTGATAASATRGAVSATVEAPADIDAREPAHAAS